ncbi:glycoside hydrolase [Nitrosomonas sp.]|uniref:glycoside hydrolase n=1 Tax=Nitrosomonas sp. TaxID=42353 RepID=UPI00261D915E|nr:glycoside hydrolase [Nitrosomonas sp.]
MNTSNKALLTTSLLPLATIKPNLLIAHKKAHQAILIALMCFISMISMSWETAHAGATTPPVTTPVKWHPGHYYSLMDHGKDASWYLSMVYKELKATPALRGIHIRYSWAELETSEGVYNFSSIAKRLTELSAIGKRLIIMLDMRTFDPLEELVPDYVKTAKYEEGVFTYDSVNQEGQQGSNIKLWNPLVRDRLTALIRALGNRFNSNAYFEGIGLTETAMGQAVIPLTSAQINDYYANMLNLQQQMRNYFPNTVTFQFTNYPRPILESFIGSLNTMGTGLGGPDVFLEEPGLQYPGTPKGVYNYYPELSGVVPLTPSVMSGNYKNTRTDGTGYQPTISELLTFARDTLKANYIFWTRNPDYYSKVLETLNMKAQKITPSGGLDATCPSTYSSCVN